MPKPFILFKAYHAASPLIDHLHHVEVESAHVVLGVDVEAALALHIRQRHRQLHKLVARLYECKVNAIETGENIAYVDE